MGVEARPRDGACLSVGEHFIGRFMETCEECGEIADHRFAGATFGGEHYLCGAHAAIALLQDAEEAGQVALIEHLRERGFASPEFPPPHVSKEHPE